MMSGFASWYAKPLWWRLGIGAAAAVAGALWRLSFMGLLDNHFEYVTFFPAVEAAALMGGIVSGGLAILLCAVFVHLWVAPFAELSDWLGLTAFSTTGLFLIGFTEALRRTWVRMNRGEARLRVANEGFQLAISTGAIGAWDFDVATNVMTAGGKMREIYGFEPGAVITPETIFATLQPDDQPAAQAAFRAALDPAGDGRYRAHYRVCRRNDGQERWISAKGQAFFERGRPVRVTGVCHDVTDEKLSEQLLLEKARLAEQLTSVAAAAPGVIYSLRISADGKACYPYVSAKAPEVCGLAPEDIRTDSRPVFRRIHTGDLDRVNASIAESAKGLTLLREEFRYEHPQKGMIWLEAQGTPVVEPNGDVTWHGYVQDVTERKRSEEALSASEARLRATIEGANDAIVTIDATGIVQSANKATAAMFGYEMDEIVGQNVCMLMPEPDRSNHDAYIRRYLDSGEAKIIGVGREIEARRKDGSLFPAELSVSEVRSDDCRLFVGLLHNLSERRRIEARVRKLHADRLNAVGGMAAGLAHEINQPLAATATYLKAARRLLQMPPELRPANVEDTLDNAAAQIMRAGRIIGHLREFIARGEPDKTLQSVHQLIEEAYDLTIAGAKRANVRVCLRLNAKDDRVLADRVQIKQVLVNLLRNAIEAMSESKERELVISTSSAKDAIRIDVADTGAGLSKEVEADLFEPFMTTKASGMGVGLSISRSIVEAHYGKIWAEPNPGGGAILCFTLPLAEAETDQ